MELRDRYNKVRENFLFITKSLEIEDYIPQPADFVSPPKWHLGHTTWFFEEFVLNKFLQRYNKYNEKFDYLFNSYYNEKGERINRNLRGTLSRPTVKEVFDYRSAIDKSMNALLVSPITDECKNLILLGIHHEMQHQELFYTDIKYTFSLNPIDIKYLEHPFAEDKKVTNSDWITINEGVYKIGNNGESFCFDNEMGLHNVYIPNFSIYNSLVSNGEYIDFIKDGGYKNYKYWHEEGWNLIQNNKIFLPLYWKEMNNQFFQYTLSGLREIQPDNILTHISHYEAFAFAEWNGCRLPTEFEWEVASDYLDWGDRWEWTSSAYLPYPGFKKSNSAWEYNGKFMINQQVLRGSSIATPAGHSRKTYRNFFHPNIGYQFNGIRLVKD